VARDTDSIERDIVRAREQLASTLDELSTRASPQRLVENARRTISTTLADPKVRAALAGVGVLVVALVVVRARR
jgi:hypothetical protein